MEYLDGPTLKVSIDFLKNLETRGFLINKIRAKIIVRSESRYGTRFVSYKSVSEIIENSLPKLSDPDYVKWIGDYLIIDNISITNTSLGFVNEFNWRDLSGTPTLTESIQYTRIQNEIFKDSVVKFETLVRDLISSYASLINSTISERSKILVYTESGHNTFLMNWKGVWKDFYIT